MVTARDFPNQDFLNQDFPNQDFLNQDFQHLNLRHQELPSQGSALAHHRHRLRKRQGLRPAVRRR